MVIGSVNAQDENNPWAITVGANAIDFFPTGADEDVARTGERGEFFEEFYNVEDHWNIMSSLSYASISRYIGKGFVFGIAGSVNRIDQIGDRRAIRDLEYFAVDGEFTYGFKKLLKSKWLDPYLSIGGGYTWLETEVVSQNKRGWGTANGGIGVRFWLTEKIHLGLKTQYKHDFDNDENSLININREHFQHVAAIGLSFGAKDTDRDGISDKNDACPTVAGLKEFNGCPDSDGDGIEDSKDTCPNVAGSEEFNGCADSDGDGVEDSKDNCPNIAGVADLGGCPDTDGDGVADADDNCPTVAGSAAQNGCAESGSSQPQVSLETINNLDSQFKSILFDYGKASIRRESYEILDNVANIMREYTNTSFLIEGHTDDKGRDSFNLNLSDRRVNSVKNYLVSKGISSSRIQSKAFGETRPIATNQTETGRQANRRVELSIITQ